MTDAALTQAQRDSLIRAGAWLSTAFEDARELERQYTALGIFHAYDQLRAAFPDLLAEDWLLKYREGC